MKKTKYIVYSLLMMFLLLGFINTAFAEQGNSENKSQNQQFSINRKGNIEIIGGVIQDIAVDKITVKVWDFNVSVNIASSTVLVRKFGGKSNTGEFANLDTVNIHGTFVSGSPLVINGLKIRDKSIHKIKWEKGGTVQSVSQDGFILKTEKGDELTVKTTGETEIKAGKEIKNLSDIKVNDKVNVSGVLNTNSNTILAMKIKIKVVVEIIKFDKVSKNKEGTIESVNIEEKSFVLKTETGDNFTIKTNSDTIIRQNGERKVFDDLKVSGKVEVKGVMDIAADSIINATRITIK